MKDKYMPEVEVVDENADFEVRSLDTQCVNVSQRQQPWYVNFALPGGWGFVWHCTGQIGSGFLVSHPGNVSTPILSHVWSDRGGCHHGHHFRLSHQAFSAKDNRWRTHHLFEEEILEGAGYRRLHFWGGMGHHGGMPGATVCPIGHGFYGGGSHHPERHCRNLGLWVAARQAAKLSTLEEIDCEEMEVPANSINWPVVF
ncbi:MAG: hypothetical protein KatS3mg030_027 [Saprospiraceae bacterium]|nr:MAG: hypothetical protein KatS3mg030_027 [Saprospiraceae bacterium]